VCALSDGSRIVSASDRTLRVWNVVTGECERVLEGHGRVSAFLSVRSCNSTRLLLQLVTSVCTFPDGSRVVSGSDDQTLRSWNVDTGVCDGVFEGHGGVS
jgi:WD40 repeat protein